MRVAHLLKQYRKSINPPYDQKDLLVIFLTIFILISIPLTSLAVVNSRQPVSKAAGTATMTVSPASLSVNQGGSFSVQVREDSAAETVNAVSAYLTFDVNKLMVANNTGSCFGFTIRNITFISWARNWIHRRIEKMASRNVFFPERVSKDLMQ